MITAEHLVMDFFRVPLERSAYQFERYDSQGCVGHAGLDLRSIRFEVGERTLDVPVGALRFVIVRSDCRGQGIGRTLIDLVEEATYQEDLPFLVAFTGGPYGFYEPLGFYHVGNGAMVLNVKAMIPWPDTPWEQIGERW